MAMASEIGEHCQLVVDWHDFLGAAACARPAAHWTTVNGSVLHLCAQHAQVCPWCHTAALKTVRVSEGDGANVRPCTVYECQDCVRIFNVWGP